MKTYIKRRDDYSYSAFRIFLFILSWYPASTYSDVLRDCRNLLDSIEKKTELRVEIDPQSLQKHRETARFWLNPHDTPHVEDITKAIQKKIGSIDGVKTVLYPMSGYDAASPFLLFPDARLAIGLSDNRFVRSFPSAGEKFGFHFPMRRDNWATMWETAGSVGVGAKIIGELVGKIKDIQIHDVTLFNTIDEDGKFERINGVVDFESNHVQRRYVHLDVRLGTQYDLKSLWYDLFSQRLKPQALLAKASMGGLGIIQTELVNLIKENHGFILEGTFDQASNVYELTYLKGTPYDGFSFHAEAPKDHGDFISLELRNANYGYSKYMQVIKFK